MQRRRALQLAGSALLVPIAGCSVPELGGSTGVTVEHVTLRNFLDRDVDVSVLLAADDSIVRWQTVTVPGPPNPFATLDDLPASPKSYVLYAQVPETDRGQPVRADLVDDSGDQSCIEVGLEVHADDRYESTVPTVVYGTIGRCDDQ